VPPSATRPSIWPSTRGRSTVGDCSVRGVSEKAIAPTRSSSGTCSRNVRADAFAAVSRSGSTSSASIERDTSVTSTIVARSSGTATVVSGRAVATTSAASASRNSAGGRLRRSMPEPRGATAATVAAPGKRTA